MTVAFDADRSSAATFFKTPIPAHDEPRTERHPATILATWPAGTFVENILPCADGSILVSVHSAGELQRWRPGPGLEHFATMPASPTAINAHPSGGLIVLGGTVGTGPQYVWHVDDDGAISEIARVDDALFFNGGAMFSGDRLLVADSIVGRVYAVDCKTGAVSHWFEHELLRKVTAEPMLPGANGIKVFGRHVYVSNTDRALFLRIPFSDDGAPESIEVVAERLRADDFAFDGNGNALLTTHIHNSLLRLTPSGERTNIATVDDGLAGSTAVAFGATPETARSVFVTTTGGVLSPYDGIVQPAKLVRIDVDSSAPQPFAD